MTRQDGTVGEIDCVDLTHRRFIELKEARGFHKVNPRTKKPAKTPAEWANEHILRKTTNRINFLQKEAVATRPALEGGSPMAPSLAEMKRIRYIEFRIDHDSPVLRTAVAQALQSLRSQFPEWRFTAEFGIDLRFPPMPTASDSSHQPTH